MMLQVLNLTPDQIARMSQEQQKTIMDLVRSMLPMCARRLLSDKLSAARSLFELTLMRVGLTRFIRDFSIY